MPIYEYECADCGNHFEQLVFSNHESITCSKCKSSRVKKRMSAFGFKSGEKFSSSAGPACNTCSSGNCSTCG